MRFMPFVCRRGGKWAASPVSFPDLAENIVPGNPVGAMTFEVVETAVQLGPLRVGERQGLRLLAEAIPDLLKQSESLFCVKGFYIR